VYFGQTSYHKTENVGQLDVELVLSKKATFPIIVTVKDINDTAVGELYTDTT